MSALCKKPDILPTLEHEGVELQQKGRYHWACCPLHSEKTPSFKVDLERQTFYCFGCHAHGDAISFIQQYKGIPFKDALRYLGISVGSPQIDPTKALQRDLVKQFRQWERDYHSELCLLYRTLQKAKTRIEDDGDLGEMAKFYHKESLWLFHIEILESGDDEGKYQLYKEVIGNGNGF